jgi:hypothetical protein
MRAASSLLLKGEFQNKISKWCHQLSARLLSTTALLQDPIVDPSTYKKMYEQSICPRRSETFWSERAKESLKWEKEFTKVFGSDDGRAFDKDGHNTWFEDGKINVSVNCVDRHLSSKSHVVVRCKTAFLCLETHTHTHTHAGTALGTR